MNCCINCFQDSFLKNHIKNISNKTGKCSFCNSDNSIIIEPKNLYERFEQLFALYEEDTGGEEINSLLSTDWNIFTEKVKTQKQKKLLELIAQEPGISKKKFKPTFLQERKNIDQWEAFREELKHNNRFFPKNALKMEDLLPFGEHIGQKIKKGDQKFFRARINSSINSYSI